MTSDALPECPVVVDAPAPTPSDMPTIHEENATAESTTVTAVIATDIATDATTALVAAEEKYPKRKVALLMSFCGTGYYGMQM